MKNEIVYFVCSFNKESSSFKRAVGNSELITNVLNKPCEIIDFGFSYLTKKRLYSILPKIIKKINVRLFCKHRVKKFLKTNQPTHIFTVFLGISTMKWLKKYCKKAKIFLICDFCEWVIKDQFKLKGLSYGYIKNNFAITKWVDKESNVIAISSYLNNYFSKEKGANSVCIPNLINFQNFKYRNVNISDNKLKLIFLGNPTRKDFSDRIIDALYELPNTAKEKVHIYMLGINPKKRVNSQINIKKMNELAKKDNITILKHVPYQEVLRIYDNTQFSIFFYSTEDRNAKALFPTKLLDAFINSRPVICNLATDIGLYAKDNYNSLIAKDSSIESIKDILIKASKLSGKEKYQLSINAFESAKMFDVNNFKSEFSLFLKRLRK